MSWTPKDTKQMAALGSTSSTPKVSKRAAFATSLKKAISEESSKRADEFPNISTFDTRDMKRALGLMQSDLMYQEQAKAVEEARKDGKKSLAELAEKYGVEGMRWGQLAVYYNGMKTRRSLSTEGFIQALASAGVDLDVIERCREESTIESLPYLDLKVTNLTPKPKP